MQIECLEIYNLEQLKEFVTHTLCQQNDFEVGVFQITEKLIKKSGRICGIYFCLHGPRSVKLTAVWETINNSILFYGSTGERFKKTVLERAPQLAAA